ncbi:uncharacterized protein METZ01_LOCUS365356, partial [marine metagenome]
FKVRFGSGSNIAIEPENPSIQMPGELRLNSPTNTKLYKIDSSYVADTSDGDGDGVPDTWDAFPNDATKVYDSDGDGVADSVDAFPLDSARSEALAGLVTPGNEVTLYYDANENDLYVHTEGLANLEWKGLGQEWYNNTLPLSLYGGNGYNYKVVGRYVKLLVNDPGVDEAQKFEDVVFEVKWMDPSAGGYYVLAITPVDPSVDVGDFDSIRPEAGTVSWEYVDYKPLPDGVDVSTGVEVTMFYRANENDFYVHGDFETAPGNAYAQDDRVILFLGNVDEETLGYELDGLVFKVRFGSGSNIAIEPENP